MLIRAQNYNYTIEWKKGKDQIIADMLSRASLPKQGEYDVEHVNMCAQLSMGSDRIEEIKRESGKDEVLTELKNMILNGFPAEKERIYQQ